MALLDTFQVTLKGGLVPDMSGTTKTVVVWFQGHYPAPENEGDVIEYLGGGKNDESMWVWHFKLKTMPFSYVAGGNEGHDFALFLNFLEVLEMPFREIVAVDGTDRIGSDGVTQFWDQQLARFAPAGIPVYAASYDQRDPDDNNVWVDVELVCRMVGLF